MKKSGILNPQLAHLLASTGHTDYVVVTDAGLPIPEEVHTRVDLTLKEGVPEFLQTLDAILEELIVEKIILAQELKEISPVMHEAILKRFQNIEVAYMPHTEFKKETKQARGLVRTGEFTSYANVILVAGVAY